MNQPLSKPFASLSATLLARKGAAKPAMRPQYYPAPETFTEGPASFAEEPADQTIGFDASDCGWNDMGENYEAEAASVEMAPAHEIKTTPSKQPVLRQQQEIAERLLPTVAVAEPVPEIAGPAAIEPVAIEPKRVTAKTGVARRSAGSALSDGRRAAFTLRLDGDRHLKLRLACTLNGRSAQMLMTDALDRLLADHPEVAALAAQVNPRR